MQFGQDDDSIMTRLATELEMEPVADQMKKLGFTAMFVSPVEGKFIRSVGNTVNGLHFQLNQHGRLRVIQSENGIKDRLPFFIESWDEWIVFVRLQVYRAQVLKATTAAQQACAEAAETATKQLPADTFI